MFTAHGCYKTIDFRDGDVGESEKRVHITEYRSPCVRQGLLILRLQNGYGRLGMLLTIDGLGNQLISLQGLGSVTVRDAAGGPPGAEFGSESSDSDDAKDEDLKDKRTKLNCWS